MVVFSTIHHRPVPLQHCDPSKPTSHLSCKSRASWVKKAQKELQNYYSQDFPPFYIAAPCYQTYHIHQFTTLDIM